MRTLKRKVVFRASSPWLTSGDSGASILLKDRDVVVCGAVRTAVGRLGGSLKDVPVQDLAAQVVSEVLTRTGVPGEAVDLVVLGNSRQTTEAANLARVALLKAGLPEKTAGYTVHLHCASALQAIISACQAIETGDAGVVAAGGAESLSRSPFYLKKARYGYGNGNAELVDSLTEAGPGAVPPEIYGYLPMGLTAENVAGKYGISRERQDGFALESQERAARAIAGGRFAGQITPVAVSGGKGQTALFEVDEFPRETSLEKLAALKPAFKKGGSVTAGNSCGQNDAASVVLLMTAARARELGLKPLARVVSRAVVGLSPVYMGMGPVPATRLALERAGLSLSDIDLVELNEAFASQSLAVIDELGLDQARTNIYGGAIALGHPVGATGAIILTKLLYALADRDKRLGLATLCIGGGQGLAIIVERVSS